MMNFNNNLKVSMTTGLKIKSIYPYTYAIVYLKKNFFLIEI